MKEKKVNTKVDELMELLKRVDKIELAKAAKEIGVPVKTLQNWVDFLVDEGLIGVEYKFTTPYIYFNRDLYAAEELTEGIEEEEEKEEINIEKFKKEFKIQAMDKDIPAEKIPDLWRNHLLNVLEEKKEFFYIQARKRGFDDKEIEQLWEEYVNKVLSV